ncbi:MAG: VWA domain-containing protein [Bacteroidetes bacterium]|nr:VWA domain-containing protein [Bacteroidota bacterium]
MTLLIALTCIYGQRDCATFTPIVPETKFILVVDVSGSMSGEPLKDAKKGLHSFVDQMTIKDEAALITFSTSIDYALPMTSNKNVLKKEITSMRSGGGTHLYDAIAKAISIAKNLKEKVAIVTLTDGQDGGSKFSAKNIESMVAYQGIAFYAIGLGTVNSNALANIAKKANGKFLLTPNSRDLKSLYQKSLDVYKRKHMNNITNVAELMVHSLPAGRDVMIDGKKYGRSPLKIVGLKPGSHEITIDFSNGLWACTNELYASKVGFIKAYESDVNKNIAIMSVPHGSAVFFDDEFIGYTSPFGKKIKTKVKRSFLKKEVKTVDYSRELILENVPKGNHKILVVPFSGSDAEGMFDNFTYEFKMGANNLILDVNILKNNVEIVPYKGTLQPKRKKYELDTSTIFNDF